MIADCQRLVMQVRFFRKGKPFKYEGKLFFEELFAWVEKMTAPA